MDVVQAVSGYISKMVSTSENASLSSTKMKILLLDSETVRLGEVSYELRILLICLGLNCIHGHHTICTFES